MLEQSALESLIDLMENVKVGKVEKMTGWGCRKNLWRKQAERSDHKYSLDLWQMRQLDVIKIVLIFSCTIKDEQMVYNHKTTPSRLITGGANENDVVILLCAR